MPNSGEKKSSEDSPCPSSLTPAATFGGAGPSSNPSAGLGGKNVVLVLVLKFELKQFWSAVNRAQHQHFDEDTDDTDGDARQQYRGPKADTAGQDLHQRIADISAQHIEAAMGKIHNPGDALAPSSLVTGE